MKHLHGWKVCKELKIKQRNTNTNTHGHNCYKKKKNKLLDMSSPRTHLIQINQSRGCLPCYRIQQRCPGYISQILQWRESSEMMKLARVKALSPVNKN